MYDNIPMHRVFISYHHANDQFYKNQLISMFDGKLFSDLSVDTGDIDENLPDERIRQIIRDEYLKDTSVTILLVGTDTKKRKHIDWEVYSSMYNGIRNKKSGILIVNLPTISQSQRGYSDEERNIISPYGSWNGTGGTSSLYPYMPERIIDNLENDVNINVIDYERVMANPEGFKRLIDIAYNRRNSNNYDISRPMRRRNG